VTRGLADTSIFIAAESGRPIEHGGLPDRLAVSIITVAELRAGVLAAGDLPTRDRRLRTLTEVLAFDPIPVDDRVAQAWAVLRVHLRNAGERMGVNDSWIAATAIAEGVPLITQDTGYAAAPGLTVIRV
jgi:predicted nucleic acid-binding protein